MRNPDRFLWSKTIAFSINMRDPARSRPAGRSAPVCGVALVQSTGARAEFTHEALYGRADVERWLDASGSHGGGKK
jgi:hypothetical protein